MMVSITVSLRDGSTRQLEPMLGTSLMESLRDNGVEDVQALCGGCCSCATCHVIFEAAAVDRLPPKTADEDDLLDSSQHKPPHSRLSCQIPVTSALDGIRLTIAPED